MNSRNGIRYKPHVSANDKLDNRLLHPMAEPRAAGFQIKRRLSLPLVDKMARVIDLSVTVNTPLNRNVVFTIQRELKT